jgi:hypothetical protein
MSFAAAEAIADAVLFEGYLLYPYRASAAKNRLRWQFGVLVPRAHGEEAGGAEPSRSRLECLVEVDPERGGEDGRTDVPPRVRPDAQLDVRLRFLHIESRVVEACGGDGDFRPVPAVRVNGEDLITWDEGIVQSCDLAGLGLAALLDRPRVDELVVPSCVRVDLVRDRAGIVRARVTRSRQLLRVRLRTSAERADGWVRLHLEIENVTDEPERSGAPRDELLRYSLVGAHTLLAARGCAFVPLTDPPAGAESAAAACVNRHTWPVLAGPGGRRDLLLASPIILPDHPVIAPESPANLHDGTEIDEMLLLRILTLTDDEKREARATDERARRIVDAAGALPPVAFARLHGAIRTPGTDAATDGPESSVDPATDSAEVRGGVARRGSRVRLRPSRRADAFDMFLKGRAATVAAVYRDFDERTHVAVTIDDDPAAELQGSTGRYYYFQPDEVELVDTAGP